MIYFLKKIAGHDTVIAPVLSALGLKSLCGWPPYASHIAIELWRLDDAEDKKSDSKFGVRIVYNGNVVSDRIEACGGKYLCPADMFADVINAMKGGHATIEEACA